MAEVRIFVRPYASSLPLGFFAFGIGMLLLGGDANGWLHPSDRHTVGLILAAFVFPLELVCAIFAFLARDTFGATGLGIFTPSWLALGLTNLMASQDALSHAVGLFEFGFAFAVVLLAGAAVAAGWLGVAIFAAAMYGGLAFLLEDGGKREVLPVFRRGTSKESLEGDLASQLAQLGDEAGVRQTL